MAALSRSDSKRLYSWWWDSHNSPKNSKWLQDNLTDIDSKVKFMIKLLEEDADSFARRAEMYYKKRPELMKLVEEFYRAYRALAERYNHATGELRHAHRTLAKAFPDQVPVDLIEDSPSKPPGTPETRIVRALFGTDDMHELKEDQQMGDEEDFKSIEQSRTFNDQVLKLSNENQHLKDVVAKETGRAGEAESEVENLRRALAVIQAEKESVLVQYQQCLAELSSAERELNNAKDDSVELNERASRAEIEVQTLKEALVQLEVEKNAGHIKHQMYLEKIANLEENSRELGDKICRLECENEEDYKQCLEKISILENLITMLENEARLLKKQAETAETQVSELQQSLADLNKEKEDSALRYKSCLETISKLERDLVSAKEEVKRLNNDVLIGNLKLRTAEDKYILLEMSNVSLQTEAEKLEKKIAAKDEELSRKQEELENLQTCLQDEHSRRASVEATLQDLHSQSQDDQRALRQELENVLCTLKDLEARKLGLEEEICQVREENHSLSEAKSYLIENMQKEILTLREIKERLEKEVSRHTDLSNSLKQEITRLEEEIEGLNRRYQALIEQVAAAGLSQKCVVSSIKSLQNENSMLREINEEASDERQILSDKLKSMQDLLDKKMVLESSLSRLQSELESSQDTVKALQESSRFLQGEKAAFVSEKASLLSQLKAMTDNMHNLLERNAVLENTLCNARVELEGLREKSKGLEEMCALLKNERSHLLEERSSLATRLAKVEGRLETLEKRYTGLEDKCVSLEREKEGVHCQVEELKISLFMEKQERSSSQLQSNTRLAGLEDQIRFLKQENGWKKKEYEEEFEKSLKAQFEISILHKFMKDMEEKNCSLIIECQKHVEASKLSEKLISELENESLEQQAEAEVLLDEIERLRLNIYQVFRALEANSDCHPEDKIEGAVRHILGAIEDMKYSILSHENEKELLLVENSVLLTLLEQLESKGMEFELQRKTLQQEFKTMGAMAKTEKDKLQELNAILKSDVSESRQHAAMLEAELESLTIKQADLHKSYDALEEAYLQVNRDNKNLLNKFSDLKEEKYKVDQHSNAALLECLATANESVVFRSFVEEKASQVKLLLSDLNRQHDINCGLERKMSALVEKLELQNAENELLKDTVRKLEGEMQGMREHNVEMKKEILSGKHCLLQTEGKLLDAEKKLHTVETFNLQLCRTVDELMTDVQESAQMKETLENDITRLSETNSAQREEMETLMVTKMNFESELSQLREQMEENTIREQALCSDLKEKSNEFELWEAEATAFYFDFQISSIHEVLFKNKVQELSGACRKLKNENASKTSEMEQMKGQISSMENEISGLKSQLYAYNPVIAALREDIMLLEHNALLQMKLKASRSHETEILEFVADDSETVVEDSSLVSLQSLQTRVNAVGKLMEEMNKPAAPRRSISKSKQESTSGELEQVKSRCFSGRDKHEHSRRKGPGSETSNTPKLQKIKTKASEAKNGMLIKDIPLDQVTSASLKAIRKKGSGRVDEQMLELWETSAGKRGGDLTIGDSLRRSFKMSDKDIVYDEFENAKLMSDPPFTDSDAEKELGVDKCEVSRSSSSSELNREVSGRRVLERLTSDAQKLESLQTTVLNLRGKLETNRKGYRKAKNVDLETVQEQLLEAEETVVNLVDLNGWLVRSIEECPSPDGKASPQKKEAVKTRRRKVTEQARKGSERIGRLQLELQKIQFILLKVEDEKNKSRNKFLKSKTIILRDFIYNGRRNSGRRKKGPLCGCFRPSSSSSSNGSSP